MQPFSLTLNHSVANFVRPLSCILASSMKVVEWTVISEVPINADTREDDHKAFLTGDDGVSIALAGFRKRACIFPHPVSAPSLHVLLRILYSGLRVLGISISLVASLAAAVAQWPRRADTDSDSELEDGAARSGTVSLTPDRTRPSV